MEEDELVDIGNYENPTGGSKTFFMEDILYWYESCYDRRFYLEKSRAYGSSSPRDESVLKLDKAIGGLTYLVADLWNKNIQLTREIERLGQELDLVRSEMDQ